jgi:hypothetical protein
MKQALVIFLSDLSHIVALIVGRPPAMICAMLIRVLSAVKPAYCSETANECTAPKYDEEDCNSSTERHGDDEM